IKNEDTGARRKRIRATPPYFRSCQMQHDTVMVEFDRPASQIQFIGQDGIVKQTDHNACKAMYALQHDDPYVRTAAIFADSIKIYLNPVFRYSSQPLVQQAGFTLNKGRTLVMRSVGIILSMAWLLFLIRLYSRTRFGQTFQ